MSQEGPILVRVEDGVCWISINRPDKSNAITSEMLDLMREALDVADKDISIGCVVIAGAGDRAFSAGADITNLGQFSSEEAREFSMKGHQTFTRILTLSKPVVAAVNGYALGGGCELAMVCDFRIASEKARFGQTEINLGLVPGWGATALLHRLVGPLKAREMIMTGLSLTAEEALRAGLINRAVPADKFLDEVRTFASNLAKGPRLALSEAKKLINMELVSGNVLAAEAESFGRLFSTGDFREGVAAFREKRKPRFTGR